MQKRWQPNPTLLHSTNPLSVVQPFLIKSKRPKASTKTKNQQHTLHGERNAVHARGFSLATTKIEYRVARAFSEK